MTTTLWRPVGAYELRLIAGLGWAAFPPRLPEQPIFYPVCNREYATEIAFRWNPTDPNSGFAGFVTEFDMDTNYVQQFERHIVGARRHQELWVPAETLDAFCEHMRGPIRVVDGSVGASFASISPWTGEPGRVVDTALAEVVALVVTGAITGGPLTQGR